MWFHKKKTKGQPAVWALITILTFPIILMAAELLGAPGLWPFAWAVLATVAVLVLEVLARGKLWIFEPGFVERISHNETPLRLLVVVGAILLILETGLIFAIATNRNYDGDLMGMIMRRQCAAQYDKKAKSLCQFLQTPRLNSGKLMPELDLIGSSMRTYTAKKWFEDEPMVTCSQKKVEQSEIKDYTIEYVALLHCTSWRVDERGILDSKEEKTAFAGATLREDLNGFYKVEKWTDDPANADWNEVLKEIALDSRFKVKSLKISPEFLASLQTQEYYQAVGLLK
ncbi:MAG: hypothetical protein ABII13_00665 [Patescibacteria group bacterium]|nr:hypothetical protein [Patescibacteria group bacterium]